MSNPFKSFIKALIPKAWNTEIQEYLSLPGQLAKTKQKLNETIRLLEESERRVKNLSTLILSEKYPEIGERRSPKNELNAREFKLYSQYGEDGILLYIFSKIGTINRRFVEFGIQDGRECNSANLSLNFGWEGLVMEADENFFNTAKKYYQKMLGQQADRVKFDRCLVTAENINEKLVNNGIKGEIDLLSIDIDSNDYWVWKAISVISPRVVVVEYNASLGDEAALTVKYEPVFDRFEKHPTGFYHGASLAAFTQLAKVKGYRLVGCDSYGVNAFFVREDVAADKLAEVTVKEAYYPSYIRVQRYSQQEQWEIVKSLNFEEV
jgi:hypothetical protein